MLVCFYKGRKVNILSYFLEKSLIRMKLLFAAVATAALHRVEQPFMSTEMKIPAPEWLIFCGFYSSLLSFASSPSAQTHTSSLNHNSVLPAL